MPDKDPDVRVAIVHSIKTLGWWTAALYLIVALCLGGAVLYAARERDRIEDHVAQTTGALCSFREDIQRRYDTTIKFIIDHPNGIPGISVEDFQRSADNLKSTLDSLKGLPCGDAEGTEVLAAHSPRDNFVEAVNRERDCKDLLPTGKRLLKKARRHSVRMARRDTIFHSELNIGRWSKVGEVVGVGPHWQSIFQALMDSRKHRRILKDCAYDRIATGIVSSGGRVWLTGRLYAR